MRLYHDSRETFVHLSHNSRETCVRMSHDFPSNVAKFHFSQLSRKMALFM